MKQTEENKLIARFMGYTYYHPEVYIDYSECGGIYERYEVFSRVPILTEEYCDNAVCFADVSNPDYKEPNPEWDKLKPFWRDDRKTICWASLNSRNYLTDLRYDKSWDLLVEVGKKINEVYKDEDLYKQDSMTDLYADFMISLHELDIEKFYNAVLNIVKAYLKDYSKYIGCYVKRHWAPFEKKYMHEILSWEQDKFILGQFLYSDGEWYDVEDSIIIVNNDIYGNRKEYRELNVNDERYIEKYYNPYK